MIIKLFTFLAGVSLLTSPIHCNKLNLIHYPSHVKFVQTSNHLETSEVPGVIMSMIGLSVNMPMKWDGLLEGNIFKRPKAVVLFSVDSTNNRDVPIESSVNSYELLQNTGDIDVSAISSRLETTNWKIKPLILDASMDNQLFDVKSNYPDYITSKTLDGLQSELSKSDWMKKHKTGSLTLASDAELTFIAELYTITQAIEKIKNHASILKTNSPNFFHFKISGLKLLEGASSYDDAIKLLNDVITEVKNDLISLYSGNVVIATATMNPDIDTKLIFGRHLQEANTTSSFNRAPKYTYMYPVIFNIILWFSIAFVIALIWISWSIWHMDPGRDSVIYRMTTQRLKRD